MNFGFKIDDRFWSATVSPNHEAGGQSTQNRGINVWVSNTNSLAVNMFVTTEPSSTDYATPFMLIVY